ncbi:hypothetical protein EIN_419090 [Entamoeba invadens IP1]|uniref:Leucine rich repeat containing protein BspA family protein n=1 Tax=Entamoeba invadens IP1 TaxID=370355 RepID=A0A0A1U7N3_ENTIV|nr:hypothetical protein EIN_419090 [Entamoeba invadens IP1]ELP87990.1 hypothetical protein EIN_419090 [Entamoeba invadens IP1]|eukprot:XP_004254761.1 hypothetical protein EIN_419090 [Entamoeba invadens IP1]
MVVLDSYHMMVVSQYFHSFLDFVHIELVCKKFYKTMSKFHYNPIPLNPKTLHHFPKIETLYVYTIKDYTFGNDLYPLDTTYPLQKSTTKPKLFYKVMFTFPITFKQTKKSLQPNYNFKHVVFTQEDARSFHGNFPTCVNELDTRCFSRVYIDTKSIEVPQRVTKVGSLCFYDSVFESVLLPNFLVSLGSECFSQCKQLTNVKLPQTIEKIPTETFSNCFLLKEITIPQKVTSIGNKAFRGCEILSQIILPNNLSEIMNSAFEGCNSLVSVVIPKSVVLIQGCAFKKCRFLEKFEFEDGVCGITEISDSLFEGCEMFKSFTIGESVTRVGYSSFKNCFNLREVVIGKSVQIISRCAFEGCSKIAQIAVPKSVLEIGERSFAKCSALSSILFDGKKYSKFDFETMFNIIQTKNTTHILDNLFI